MTRIGRRRRGTPGTSGLSRKVAALLAPWKWTLAAVAIFVVASALAALVPAFVVRHVINVDLVPHRTAGLVFAAGLYVGALAFEALFTFAYAYLGGRVSQSAVAALRVRLFDHATALPVSYFDHTPIGDVISRATADVETIDELFTDGVATLLGQLVPVFVTAAAMIALSPVLAAVAAVVLPPLLIVVRFLQVRVREAQRANRLAVGRVNVELAEVVGGAETVRAFGRQHAFVSRFRTALTRTLLAQRTSFKYNALFAPVSALLSSIVIALLLWVGAGHTLVGAGVNLGTLTAFVLLFQSFFAPIVALGDQWQSIQAAVAGAERVFELLDMPTEEKPSLGHPDLETGTAAGRGVELSGVGFAYTSGRAALAEVSFAIEPGEHLALVGRTGAGKSTIVALAGGLYAPHSGTVRLAGLDPHKMADDERRRLVGVVPQTLQLFSGTLRDNLSFFDPRVPDDAIWDALRIAGVVRLVDSLPGRLDVLIAGQGGGRGATLSAGQRQLLALARALVPRPAVLLLDEATAVVDAASDAAFRAALRQTALRRGCAVLTVAHRIATARSADRVVVLEDGRVVEIGTPAGLMEGGGRFAAFAALEAAGWDWQAPLAAGADATVSSAGRDASPSAD